jgi:hypothetical protein
MPMGEGSAFAVLTGQSDGMAFQKERRKCERLPGRPIKRLGPFGHLPPQLKLPQQFLVEMEGGGDIAELQQLVFQLLGGDVGIGKRSGWLGPAVVPLPATAQGLQVRNIFL